MNSSWRMTGAGARSSSAGSPVCIATSAGVTPSAVPAWADAAWLWMFNEVAPEWGLAALTHLPNDGVLPFDDLGMPRHMPFPGSSLVRHDALWDTPLWALAGMTVRGMEAQRVATNRRVAQATASGR